MELEPEAVLKRFSKWLFFVGYDFPYRRIIYNFARRVVDKFGVVPDDDEVLKWINSLNIKKNVKTSYQRMYKIYRTFLKLEYGIDTKIDLNYNRKTTKGRPPIYARLLEELEEVDSND